MKTIIRFLIIPILLAGLLLVSQSAPARAQDEYGICTLTDSGDNTANINALATFLVNPGCITINFSSPLTLTLSQTLVIGRNVTIDGAGQVVTFTGSGYTRLIEINTGVTVTLNNLTLLNSRNVGDTNGAIINRGSLTVTNSAFIGNSAKQGGAIWNQGTLDVTNSTFANNSAGQGGAIYNAGGTITLTNDTFAYNTASLGGAIDNGTQPGTLILRNSLLIHEVSSAGNCYGALDASSENNMADDASCGDYNQGELFGLTVGPLGNYGGYTQTIPLYNFSPALDAYTQVPITDCPATDQRGITRPQSGYTTSPATCDIGAFESRGFTLVASSGGDQTVAVETSFAAPLVVTLYETGGKIMPVSNQGITFSAPASGASAIIPQGLMMDGVASVTATANEVPGSYTVLTDFPGITNATFSLTNTCVDPYTVTSNADDGPGSLRHVISGACPGGTVTFNGDYTGADTIRLASPLTLGRDITIDGGTHAVTLSGDSTGDGSSDVQIMLVNGGVTAALQNLTFEKGYAAEGGAILNRGNLTVAVSTFSNNVATQEYYGNGGAIRNAGQLTVQQSTFSGNQALGYYSAGGAIYSTAAMSVTDSVFSDGWAIYGGAIYNTSSLTVEGSTFSGNHTNAYGGAIYNSSTLTVEASTFSGNHTDSYAGVIYNARSLTVTDSTFTGNYVAHSGGVIEHTCRSGSTISVTGNTFSGNSAGYGGVLYIDVAPSYPCSATTTTMSFTNNTFSSNSASSGGVLYVSNFRDQIVKGPPFTNNTSKGNSSVYYSFDTVNVELINNVIAGACGSLYNGSITGKNNLTDDFYSCYYVPGTFSPDLRLSTLGDYGGPTQTVALLPGSPALNTGDTTACPATDQRGVARPQGVSCDIGAVESRGFSLIRTGGHLQSTPVNTAFSLPLQVTLSETGGSPLPGGTVTFTAPSTGASTYPATFSALTDASGVTQAFATANSTLGMYPVIASVPGGSNTVEFVLSNTKAVPTVTLTSSPNPSLYKQRVTFTATVTGSSGMPTGTVTFYENAPADAMSLALEKGDSKKIESLAAAAGATGNVVTLVNGVATFTTSSLSVGSHSMVAYYSGDTGYDMALSNIVDQGVSKAPAVITQPADLTVKEGETASFSADAIGYPDMTVQWQVSTDSGKTWNNIDGATTIPLTFTASFSQNGTQYRVIFTNTLGSATSQAAALTVTSTIRASIAGMVFNDADGDGVLDLSEAGLAGWSVQLLNPADSSLISTVQTGADGGYSFLGLDPATYRVRLALPLPAGYVQTTANPADITLADGQALTGVNYGAVMSADLKVTMTSGYNQTTKVITYTITVTNDGPATATAATLTDSLPNTVSFSSVTTSVGTCSGTKTVTCSFGNLAYGSSVTVVLKVTRTSTKAVNNTVTVSSNTFDIDKADNSVTVTVR